MYPTIMFRWMIKIDSLAKLLFLCWRKEFLFFWGFLVGNEMLFSCSTKDSNFFFLVNSKVFVPFCLKWKPENLIFFFMLSLDFLVIYWSEKVQMNKLKLIQFILGCDFKKCYGNFCIGGQRKIQVHWVLY